MGFICSRRLVGGMLHLSARRSRFVDRPGYCAAADRAGKGTAAQVRNTPEYFVAATYQVPPYVMKPAWAPAHFIAVVVDETMGGQYGRVHFDVIKKGHFPGSCS